MPAVYSAATLAVVAVYYVWRAFRESRQRRERLLRCRVAYMLWVMAEQTEPAVSGPAAWRSGND